MKKAFVLDTNILMHDPQSMFSFEEHDVIIPLTAIMELDNNKKRSIEARIAIRNLEKITQHEDCNPANGSQIYSETGDTLGRLLLPTESHLVEHPEFINLGSTADNKIIATALHYQNNKTCYDQVVFVTKDFAARVIARGVGVKFVEDYQTDFALTDASMLDTGFVNWESEIRFSDSFTSCCQETFKSRVFLSFETEELKKHPLFASRLFPNMYIIDRHDDVENEYYCVRSVTKESVQIEALSESKLMGQTAMGIKPKDDLQALAMHGLLDPDITLVSIGGAAGSGKTLLSLVCACEATMERREYDGIIFTRNTVDAAEPIGFLPGTEDEKLSPWMGALWDSLEAITKDDENPQSSIEEIVRMSGLKVTSLNYVRGRTVARKVLIFDEVQNATPALVRTVASRMGEGSKLILLGNIKQIDTAPAGNTRYNSTLNNGMVTAIESYKDFQFGSHIILKDVIRSALAEYTENLT